MEKEKVKPWADDMEIMMGKLDALQTQVDTLTRETKDMVSAFNAAQGAFTALDWLARTVKPIIVVVGAIAAAVLWLKGVKV
jgi:hypothetical protein